MVARIGILTSCLLLMTSSAISGIEIGSSYTVSRTADIDGSISSPGGSFPLRFSQEVVFGETVERLDDDLPTEVVHTVSEAGMRSHDMQTDAFVGPPAPTGDHAHPGTADEFKAWEPVAGIILNSVKLNPQWVIGEMKGQQARGETVTRVYQDINRIGREMVEHQQKTNAEIMNDAFLTLTEQEEYVNPFTNEVEVGSNQWEHRWTNPGGDIIYTSNEYYDPNTDVDLNRSDIKRTPIRKRFPQ